MYGVWVFSLYVFVHHVCSWCQLRLQRRIRFPGTGVTDLCEPRCGCWESTPGPLGEQSGLFAAESFLQPALNIISFKFIYLFRDRVSLCSPVTPYIDQAGLELRDLSVSTS